MATLNGACPAGASGAHRAASVFVEVAHCLQSTFIAAATRLVCRSCCSGGIVTRLRRWYYRHRRRDKGSRKVSPPRHEPHGPGLHCVPVSSSLVV